MVGVERSGTTLVRAILDAHPDLAIPQESYFVVELALGRERYERPEGFDADAVMDDLAAHVWFRRWELPEQDVRTAVAGATNYAGAIRAVFGAWARVEGKPRYGDKSPRYVLALPLLAELFPESRFLHVIRDGRDVSLSFSQQFDLPVPLAMRRWRRRVGIGRSDGIRLGPDRYLEIRYEDLVADPEQSVRQVCAFIDVPFDASMLRHHERAERLLGPMHDRFRHERIALPVSPGLRDWRDEMSPADLALCEHVGGELLSELGYELSGRRPSVFDRARLFHLRVRHRRRFRLFPRRQPRDSSIACR